MQNLGLIKYIPLGLHIDQAMTNLFYQQSTIKIASSGYMFITLLGLGKDLL